MVEINKNFPLIIFFSRFIINLPYVELQENRIFFHIQVIMFI